MTRTPRSDIASKPLVSPPPPFALNRDLKPENVLLEARSMRCKLADFGLARTASAVQASRASEGLAGTPAYMAPEALASGNSGGGGGGRGVFARSSLQVMTVATITSLKIRPYLLSCIFHTALNVFFY